MKKLPINEIVDLYSTKKMNSGKIAERYACCKSTIIKRLRAAKISIRSPGVTKLKISNTELGALYVGKKLSTWKIANLLKCGRSTIHRKLRKLGMTRDAVTSHIIYKRKSFDGSEKERAYLMGFAVGDLRVRKIGRKSRTIKIDCGSTKKEQIDLIYKLFSRYGRVWVSKPYMNGKKQIEAFLDDSFEFLLNCRHGIDGANGEEQFVPFLAGFTDAEGSVFITNGKACYSIGNYDHELLQLLKNGLVERGVSPVHIYSARKKYAIAGGYKQRQVYWQLRISRKESLLKLFNILGPYIRHGKRRRDIQNALKNIALRGNKTR